MMAEKQMEKFKAEMADRQLNNNGLAFFLHAAVPFIAFLTGLLGIFV